MSESILEMGKRLAAAKALIPEGRDNAVLLFYDTNGRELGGTYVRRGQRVDISAGLKARLRKTPDFRAELGIAW